MGRPAGRHLVEVAPGVHVATATTYTTTSTAVVADDGTCLLVDPALTRAELQALARAVTDRGWRPAAGFVTHPHWDHLLWPCGLDDVPRWATAAAVRWAGDHEDRLRAEAAQGVPDLRPSTVGLTTLPAGTAAVPWPGPTVEVLAHRAHAPGHAALLTGPVLVAGDMLSDVEVPLLDLDAAAPLADYHEGLDRLGAVLGHPGTSVLVPGHGRVTDRRGALARLAADRRYLDALTRARTTADPRLADDWVRGQHRRQLDHLRERRP